MPDQSSVERALAQTVAAIFYPNGPDEPSALGPDVRIYRGWPSPPQLDADLAAGRLNITVQAVSGSARNTTRFSDEWSADVVPPTLTAAVVGTTATFVGDAAPGQLAGLLIDGAAWVHRTRRGDTPALVAASLAAQVRPVRPAQLVGASVTFPGAGRVTARTVADATATRELRRQEATFRLTAWCPSPEVRDEALVLLDAGLAERRVLDVDGVPCRLRYAGTASSDDEQAAGLYRRDLLWDIDYPTTARAQLPTQLFGTAATNATPTTT